MLAELLLFTLVGVLVGVLSGLTPGLHINTVAVLVLGVYYSYNLDPLFLSVFLLGVAVSHAFVDFIPSIFLGAPDPSTALSVLPGHKMLLDGRGYEALVLTVIGGIYGMILLVICFPLVLKVVPYLYEVVQPYIHVILIACILYMCVRSGKIVPSLFIFLLSGVYGLVALGSGIINQNYLLFPVLGGLFGVSTLILSYKTTSSIPPQRLDLRVKNAVCLKGGICGFIGGVVAGLLPGLGSSQATVLVQEFFGIRKAREFLVAIGAITTINVVFSIIALYLIGKARSGGAIVIGELMGDFDLKTVLIFLGLGLFSTGIASIITIWISKRIVPLIEKINYRLLILCVIGLLLFMTYMFTGAYGMLILFIGTLIGVTTQLLGVRKSFAMGVLILPVILYFSGLGYLAILLYN